jgi:hypothetical protein
MMFSENLYLHLSYSLGETVRSQTERQTKGRTAVPLDKYGVVTRHPIFTL